ncbi:PD-(D/E)XK nuclease family protein [Chloroflexota bacterium]
MEEAIRPLSFTQISLYRSCPLLYKLRYIDGLKAKDRWYFSFGSTMHLCAEYFFKVSVPPPPSLKELLQFYEENWLPQGYESAEEESSYKEYGREILTKFWKIHSVDFQMPLAVEKLFYIDIDGVKLRGFIDRVDKLESSGLSVIDYKTNKELFTADYLQKDLQLTLYQLAGEQMWQLPVERLTLYHLRSNTALSCPPRDETQLKQVKQMVLDVAGKIANQNFPATENEYCPCDFPEHCPYYRHKYLEAAPQSPQQDMLPGLVIAETVEKYASLQEQMKELQLQLDELKETIIDFCQTEELNRVYGGEHSIDYKLVERIGFDEEAARALLEPLELWDRVVKADQSRLKELLADEEIAKDIRQKLEAIKQIISCYPQLRVKKRIEEECLSAKRSSNSL